MPTDGLYIHVPFCKSRCIYCDFYSTTCGADKRQAYTDALCYEMRLRRNFLDGGTLEITVSEEGAVTMTGPAETVYEGETV